MKKIFLVLCGIVLLGGFGVLLSINIFKHDKVEEILHEDYYGFGWGETNEIGIICNEIKNAKSYSQNYFLTTSGDLYKFNATKLFSNDKNCIKTEYGNDNLEFLFLNEIYDKNHDLVYIIQEDDILTKQEYEEKYGNTYSPNELVTTEDYDFITFNSEVILVKDNVIYWYDTNNQKKELGKIPTNEKVLYLNGALIKTDKAYWTLNIANEEECNTYADVKCEITFLRSPITQIYDKIIFASGNMIVDNQYRVFGKGRSFYLNEIFN